MNFAAADATDAVIERAPLRAGFSIPTRDLAEILEPLGTKLYTRERTLVQLLAWSLDNGLLELLDQREAVTTDEASTSTALSRHGADALLGVLAALSFVRRFPDGRYSLTPVSHEYLVRRSPFFIGDQLEAPGLSIPGLYLKRRIGWLSRMRLRALSYLPLLRYGTRARIENQHSRNLAACATAIRRGDFASARCIVDIAGGSGVFAIPLVLDYPEKRVILTELPRALPNIVPLLAAHGVKDRIELRGLDALHFPWEIPECDGIFIGNFLHGFADDICLRICREAFTRLSPGGRLWVHEMLWNDNRDGPLITALWHAAMLSSGAAGQRTGPEWTRLLQEAGFADIGIVPTASAFALVAGTKPAPTGRSESSPDRTP